MTVPMTPDMANFAGNVHGGAILKLLDQVAYACASRYAGTETPDPLECPLVGGQCAAPSSPSSLTQCFALRFLWRVERYFYRVGLADI
jgi:hypothetical protein